MADVRVYKYTKSEDVGRTSTSLLQLAREGEEESWKQLVDTYGPMVYRWCCKAGVEKTDLADVAQEVFMAVSQSLGSFRRNRPRDSFRRWICAITTNKVRDYWRERQSQAQARGGSTWKKRMQEVASKIEEDSRLTAVVKGDVDDLRQMAIDLVRRDTSLRDWTIFERSVVDDETPRAVAIEFGVSVNVVYLVKSRILKRLRDAAHSDFLSGET